MKDTTRPVITDLPQRYELANELHARPFPTLQAPCHAVYLAIKPAKDAAQRDRDEDRTHLLALLDRFGATHPKPGATHYFGDLGKHKIKWESHTEFSTYTIFTNGVAERPFDPATFDVFPPDWLADLPGHRLTSALIRVEMLEGDETEVIQRATDWFVPESVAVSHVLDGSAIISGDFRIDTAGHMRFALFVKPGTGSRRVGRIVQRLAEIETYKSMSMLGLPMARDLSRHMADLDRQLTQLMGDMTGTLARPEESLTALLSIAAELENLLARSTFRFGATGAYEAIILERIEALREVRMGGRQTFKEFMTRRFDPAMRTIKSTEARLQAMAQRAIRAGDLLRTRVDVERQAQNQKLLESMDRRADLQLRLQKTVEGLSVVAISYYAVNLVVYMTGPVGQAAGLSKLVMTSITTPLVILAVWGMVRRIRRKME
ncbi:DUF3422 family protein [Actibacterium sp. 188UL27-1]|uniref:DUF3422 family protein n=1 Tax=Actibacterium sp. 188UL27-1 TaxID=2786961 RepID=UPI0019572B97|nr:DUF3422 domain-containing protein [Actibacterium sp. 188UL27-1]MBM7067954.1 DUF3422 domain-containing protein [Actibacterium sp. 188UL27-1]